MMGFVRATEDAYIPGSRPSLGNILTTVCKVVSSRVVIHQKNCGDVSRYLWVVNSMIGAHELLFRRAICSEALQNYRISQFISKLTNKTILIGAVSCRLGRIRVGRYKLPANCVYTVCGVLLGTWFRAKA